MKPDKKWQQLVAESYTATKLLQDAAARVLVKQAAAGEHTPPGTWSPNEDARLKAALDVWHGVNIQIMEFFAENLRKKK